MQKSTNLALIDVDSLYFRICYKTTKKNEIRKNIDLALTDIEGETFMAHPRIAIKGRGNFRKDLYPEYKKNRKELPADLKVALNYAHEYLVEEKGAIMADGMEADDLVSIWAYEAREEEIPYVICGIDKDLLQIPGNHYNFVKREHQFIDDEVAHYKLMIQCITGDSTDNIPGLKGIGPVKAKKMLDGKPTSRLWGRVQAAWRGHGRLKELDTSYKLLRMLTSWKDHEDIKEYISSKADIGQPKTRSSGKESV